MWKCKRESEVRARLSYFNFLNCKTKKIKTLKNIKDSKVDSCGNAKESRRLGPDSLISTFYITKLKRLKP
jgi:hypothetical protein